MINLVINEKKSIIHSGMCTQYWNIIRVVAYNNIEDDE